MKLKDKPHLAPLRVMQQKGPHLRFSILEKKLETTARNSMLIFRHTYTDLVNRHQHNKIRDTNAIRPAMVKTSTASFTGRPLPVWTR